MSNDVSTLCFQPQSSSSSRLFASSSFSSSYVVRNVDAYIRALRSITCENFRVASRKKLEGKKKHYVCCLCQSVETQEPPVATHISPSSWRGFFFCPSYHFRIHTSLLFDLHTIHKSPMQHLLQFFVGCFLLFFSIRQQHKMNSSPQIFLLGQFSELASSVTTT